MSPIVLSGYSFVVSLIVAASMSSYSFPQFESILESDQNFQSSTFEQQPLTRNYLKTSKKIENLVEPKGAKDLDFSKAYAQADLSKPAPSKSQPLKSPENSKSKAATGTTEDDKKASDSILPMILVIAAVSTMVLIIFLMWQKRMRGKLARRA